MTAAKRKPDWADQPDSSAKSARKEGGGKMSFGERMMAKMGYQAGQGLGKHGTGIVKPIEVVIRPQGVGVGAVRERPRSDRPRSKTAPTASESESDDGDNARSGAPPKTSKTGRNGGTQPRPAPKPRFRTSADIEAAAAGLAVPTVFKTIIDLTGPGGAVETSLSGLALSADRPAETDADRLARRARLDLDRYVDQWNSIGRERASVVDERARAERNMNRHQPELDLAQQMVEAGRQLATMAVVSTTSDGRAEWDILVPRLIELGEKFSTTIRRDRLATLAVSALARVFRRRISRWDPIDDPVGLAADLTRLGPLLGIGTARKRPVATPFESLIVAEWLPRVRRAVTTEWDVYQPGPMVALVSTWMGVIPDFVANRVVNDLVATRLRQAADSTKAGVSAPIESWLFPWLELLAPDQLATSSDPDSEGGSDTVVASAGRALGRVLGRCDLATVPDRLADWSPVLGRSRYERLIVTKLLPRLARHLAAHFDVNPSDQKMEPITTVLGWVDVVPVAATAELIATGVMGKLVAVLHAWLIDDNADWAEVADWFEWWKTQIPAQFRLRSELAPSWKAAVDLMSQAADRAEAGMPIRTLSMPDLSQIERTRVKESEAEKQRAVDSASDKKPVAGPEPEPTFADVVAEWCEAESVVFVPLREMHPILAAPVFRITASASAKGGVRVCVADHVVWAHTVADRAEWDPVRLGADLVALAGRR